MPNDAKYNGWTNYETWAVKLWIDNDEGSYTYWGEAAQEAWNDAEDKSPNQFMDRPANARLILSERLKDEHDSQSDHPVFAASDGTVYADLLNAALGSVNWREIADALLEDVDKTDDDQDDEEDERDNA